MTRWTLIAAALAVAFTPAVTSGRSFPSAATPPQLLRQAAGSWRLTVQGKPFLALGGELGNSSAGTAARADSVLPRLAAEHFNTVLMPVAWVNVFPSLKGGDFRLLEADVPPQLLRALAQPAVRLSRRLADHFTPDGSDWAQVFGDAADEAFMAWYYARFGDQVAQAGKHEYRLPMYMNAQLPAPRERAGDYPSGGPYPFSQPIYRAAAPAIDFYAPDIYWPDFERWVDRYQELGNPAFVPESRPQLAPYDALYVFGQARGFGFSAFGIETSAAGPGAGGAPAPSPRLADVYETLSELGDRFLQAQAQDETRAARSGCRRCRCRDRRHRAARLEGRPLDRRGGDERRSERPGAGAAAGCARDSSVSRQALQLSPPLSRRHRHDHHD